MTKATDVEPERIAFFLAETDTPVFLRELSILYFKVKPCPFCGTRECSIGGENKRFHIKCTAGCILSGPCGESVLSAINKWNTRRTVWHQRENEGLKTCPFCGPSSAVTLVETASVFMFECPDCHASEGGNFARSIFRWNRRSLLGRLPWTQELVIGWLQGPVKEELLLAGLRCPYDEAEAANLKRLASHNQAELARINALRDESGGASPNKTPAADG